MTPTKAGHDRMINACLALGFADQPDHIGCCEQSQIAAVRSLAPAMMTNQFTHLEKHTLRDQTVSNGL
jgi:hypothetical protein